MAISYTPKKERKSVSDSLLMYMRRKAREKQHKRLVM